MFTISFEFSSRTYTGSVQKLNHNPVQYVVFDIHPWVRNLPAKLVYESNPVNDQLIYCSFNVGEKQLLQSIGESIFIACYEQRIAVHR